MAGWGMRNLRERAAAMGAVLDVESVAGEGTIVRLRLPLQAGTRAPGRNGSVPSGAHRPWAPPPCPATLADSMFLKTVIELAADFADVRSAMLREPKEWLAGLGAEAAEEGDRLVVEVGLQVAGRAVGGRARLEVGEPMTTDRVVMLPVRLCAPDHRRLFPTMEGSLDAAWLGRGRTYLSLGLTYEPPLGLVGRVADRALLHRVAETVAQRLLQAVAHELTARTLERGQPPDPPAGTSPAAA